MDEYEYIFQSFTKYSRLSHRDSTIKSTFACTSDSNHRIQMAFDIERKKVSRPRFKNAFLVCICNTPRKAAITVTSAAVMPTSSPAASSSSLPLGSPIRMTGERHAGKHFVR